MSDNNFDDFFKNRWINKVEIEFPLIYEKYFNLLCEIQSDYDFNKFFDERYEWISGQAHNCIEIGMDNIEPRKAREWLMSLVECITGLIYKFIVLSDEKFIPKKTSPERDIYIKIKTFGKEWEAIGSDLNYYYSKSRNKVAHTPNCYSIGKSYSKETLKIVMRYKENYKKIHIKTLNNIKKSYPQFSREMKI